jgi:glycosyltransferase involved in cell wall biosynthesis
VALADALARLAEDRELARRLGEAGRERLQKHFSIDKMVGDTETLYRELLEERV